MFGFTDWPSDLAEDYRSKGYWIDRPLTDILTLQSKNDDIAIVCGEKEWSYRKLNIAVDCLASSLIRRGVRKGETALIQLGNEPEYYVVFFALLRIGVIPVSALFSHQSSELLAYAEQISPTLLFIDRRHNLFSNDNFLNILKSKNISLNIIVSHNTFESNELTLDLKVLLSEPFNSFVPSPTNDVAFFQLSGGSTGTPKLIPRTHNDYYYSIRESCSICKINKNTRYLCALPIAHNYSMSSPGALGVFYVGGKVILSPDPSPYTCFPLIKKHQINFASLIPPAVINWLEAIKTYDNNDILNSLLVLQVGGARCDELLARRIPKELGCQLQQVFGMAEGLVNYTRLDDNQELIFTTQGRPISKDDEVWVADPNGNPLPYGHPGLLMTRGPYTFRGYYNSDEYNKKVIDINGFYCSGDIVIQTKDGYLKVVGREKDQINRGGEKIASEEIEHLLLQHPNILNVALVSIPDDFLGEKSCAFIIARNPIKSIELRRWVRNQGVATYKLPDQFEFISELPLTAVGKIDKKALREFALKNNQNNRRK